VVGKQLQKISQMVVEWLVMNPMVCSEKKQHLKQIGAKLICWFVVIVYFVLFCVFLLIKKTSFLGKYQQTNLQETTTTYCHILPNSQESKEFPLHIPQNDQLNGTRKGLRISVLIFLGVPNIRCQQ